MMKKSRRDKTDFLHQKSLSNALCDAFHTYPSRRKYSAKAHSQITTHSLHTQTHHEIHQKVVDCMHIIVCDGLRFAREQVI